MLPSLITLAASLIYAYVALYPDSARSTLSRLRSLLRVPGTYLRYWRLSHRHPERREMYRAMRKLDLRDGGQS